MAAVKQFRDAIQPCIATTDAADRLVFLNGDILGHTHDVHTLVEAVRRVPPPGPRHLPYFAPSVYVAPCGDHVYIHCDEGRLVRPLLTVPQACDGHRWAVSAVLANASVEQLLNTGALRYVDAAEISTLNVALFPDRAPSPAGSGRRSAGPAKRSPERTCSRCTHI
jgi:hypothetical protein